MGECYFSFRIFKIYIQFTKSKKFQIVYRNEDGQWFDKIIFSIKEKYHEALKYQYHNSYDLINAYVFPDNIDEWENCPVCNSKPKIWTFNNGRSTGCKCHNSKYDHFSISAESIISHHKRKKGNTSKYDVNELCKNWNYWCKTGKIKFKQNFKKKRW